MDLLHPPNNPEAAIIGDDIKVEGNVITPLADAITMHAAQEAIHYALNHMPPEGKGFIFRIPKTQYGSTENMGSEKRPVREVNVTAYLEDCANYSKDTCKIPTATELLGKLFVTGRSGAQQVR